MAKARNSFKGAMDRRVTAYAAAAMAAGVGVMALAQPAEGEVVITRKKISIPVSYSLPGQTVPISLNNDGINDFSFSIFDSLYHSVGIAHFTVKPLEGGAVMGEGKVGVDGLNGFYASMLKRGDKIGPSAHFSSQDNTDVEAERKIVNSTTGSSTWHTYGNFGGNPSNTYVGVRFLIDGETHYGWVRLTVGSGALGMAGTITAYAYETEANKRILAGIPENGEAVVINDESKKPSLGALAAGAEGLARWRNRAAPAQAQQAPVQ